MAPQLAYIGLGNMGSVRDLQYRKQEESVSTGPTNPDPQGMAKNLVEKGNLSKPLILYNRTLSTAEELANKLGGEGKAIVAKSVEDVVAKSDIIFTCLSNDKAILSVMEAALKGEVKGKLFVDNSTVHPDTTDTLNKKATEAGAEFVASPVFGAPAMAQNGQLVCVLAGPAHLVEKVKPYTKGVMGRENIDFSGETPGKASLMKLLGNTFILQMVETLGEGHTAAEKTGLGVDNMHTFVQTMFPGPFTAYSGRMLSGDYYTRDTPQFSAENARKDAKHALALADKAGAKMRAVELVDQHLEVVQKQKGEKGDIAGVYGAIRMEAGLPYENQK
ncbi:MAG: hypothetical protein LQ340_003198 [Diploschistes diacapsis]|nr:MAG: hypothetical protein LQ340_003198 [Diploschistes diacapsis]